MTLFESKKISIIACRIGQKLSGCLELKDFPRKTCGRCGLAHGDGEKISQLNRLGDCVCVPVHLAVKDTSCTFELRFILLFNQPFFPR